MLTHKQSNDIIPKKITDSLYDLHSQNQEGTELGFKKVLSDSRYLSMNICAESYALNINNNYLWVYKYFFFAYLCLHSSPHGACIACV